MQEKPLYFLINYLHNFNVRNYIPFIREYFGWCKGVATGVYPGFHSVPLHYINLKSDFVLGTVNSWSKTCTFPCNKVSSSTRGFFVAKVTAHAGKTPVFSN
jgi:hypothetical protein